MKKNVLLSGGSGFVGKALTQVLVDSGFSVSVLSRSKRKNTEEVSYYTWDVSKQLMEEEAVLKADYIIHLAGENIAGARWTSKRKNEIIASRVDSIKLIYTILVKNNKKLEAFVSASGIGIYGAVNGEEICTEQTPPVDDFLGSTCQKWEAAAETIQNLGIRTVKIRTGLVLGENDGFLKKLTPIFKLKLGSALGSGKQYMPWIHIDDLCAIYLQSLNNVEMKGAYNAAVADATNNTIFSTILAKIYGYKLWLPNVPSFLIRLGMGEMAVIILTGRRVSADKIKKTGFEFRYLCLEKALRNCIR
jgi:uncharacterized protein (TIGR01777 family)